MDKEHVFDRPSPPDRLHGTAHSYPRKNEASPKSSPTETCGQHSCPDTCSHTFFMERQVQRILAVKVETLLKIVRVSTVLTVSYNIVNVGMLEWDIGQYTRTRLFLLIGMTVPASVCALFNAVSIAILATAIMHLHKHKTKV